VSDDDLLRRLRKFAEGLDANGWSEGIDVTIAANRIGQLQNEKEVAFNEGYELAEQEIHLSDLSDCPYYVGTGTCSYGCSDEPACQTSCPSGGWPAEQHPLVAKLQADNARLTAALAAAHGLLRSFVEPGRPDDMDAIRARIARLAQTGGDT